MKLAILQYGDPVLRAKGKRVERIDDHIREMAENMIETMRAANGVGLAAQQVGEAIQLTVIDVSQSEDRPSGIKLNGKEVDLESVMPLVLINPHVELDAETERATEGCLSFPEITGEIERATSITVRAQNLAGEMAEIEARGLLARAIQHEVDHLNGVLFIDRMSSAAKVSLSSRLKRLQKETQRGHRIHLQDRQLQASETTL
jgi:peptide deformylase